jgi:hypothetical protein
VTLERTMRLKYGRAHGNMHSTGKWPSNSERCSELPRMPWPLRRLQLLLVPVLLLTVAKHPGRPEQRRRV